MDKKHSEVTNIPLLHDQNVPAGMVTLLWNRNIIDGDFLAGIDSMQSLEMEIFKLDREYRGQDEILQRVFHLVQIWGGTSGRYVYIRQDFNWEDVRGAYRQIVETCLRLRDSGVDSQRILYEELRRCRIRYVGVSFITKHTRFWLTASCGEDVLPIYDRYMAELVLNRPKSSWDTLLRYWSEMKRIAEERNVSLLRLERELTNTVAE